MCAPRTTLRSDARGVGTALGFLAPRKAGRRQPVLLRPLSLSTLSLSTLSLSLSSVLPQPRAPAPRRSPPDFFSTFFFLFEREGGK